MKKAAALLLFILLFTAGALGVLVACGVKVAAGGQWDLINCKDKEGNILAYGANYQGGSEPKMNASCEVTDADFILRENGSAAYADYTKRQEDGKLFLTVTFEDGGQAQAECYIYENGAGEYQIMVLTYGSKIYTFRKIA